MVCEWGIRILGCCVCNRIVVRVLLLTISSGFCVCDALLGVVMDGVDWAYMGAGKELLRCFVIMFRILVCCIFNRNVVVVLQRIRSSGFCVCGALLWVVMDGVGEG